MILITTKKLETFFIQSQKVERIGYKTIHADSYQETLKILKDKKNLKLIIVDMDTIDNLPLLIKEIILIAKLPILFITDHPEKEISKDLYTDYSYGFILKNSGDFILQSSIKTALNLSEFSKRKEEKHSYIQQAELISKFGYWEFDLTNKVVKASKGAKQIYGLTEEEFSIEEIKKYPQPKYREMLDMAFEGLIYRNESYNVEFKVKNKIKNKIISVRSIAEYDPKKNIVRGILYDISKQDIIKRARLEKEREHKKIFKDSHAPMLVIDSETTKIIDINDAAVNFYGWKKEVFTNMKITDINILNKDIVKGIIKSVDEEGKNHFVFKHRLSNETIKDVEVYYGKIKIGGKTRLFSTIQDITKQKDAESKIKELIYYDTLTHLPNRRMFFKNFENLISHDKNSNSKITLLNIDLDGFKKINDNFGHDIGDKLLKKVADRLRKKIRKCQIIYRMGGDEFAIIIQNLSSREDISVISNRIRNFLKTPFRINDKEIFISASIGIAIYPYDGTNVNNLLKNSDIAMYKSKNRGKDIYSFFSEEMNFNTKITMEIETNLRNAIKNNEFQLYYQPKIDVLKNKVIGAESLLRWFKDGKQYMGPFEFICIAESTGFILEIDKWVLLTACTQIKNWAKIGIKDQKISVNISGKHFKQNRIIKTVKEVLKKVNIPKGTLEIEITEGAFMEDMEESIVILNELRAMGIEISIDDFGTGYSSLSYLKNLPIDRIKIDRSFISNILNGKKDAAIVKTIITMANLLDLYVIAEGVETLEQLELLSENGCSEIQGYYFSKPIPAIEYEDFVKNWGK